MKDYAQLQSIIYGWLIDFNTLSISLGLFYAERLGNYVHFMYVFTFYSVFCNTVLSNVIDPTIYPAGGWTLWQRN